jgi:hypothetical protein
LQAAEVEALLKLVKREGLQQLATPLQPSRKRK